MHEYSIVDALLDRVEAEAAARHARAVKRLSVRVGELAGVEVGLLVKAYETFRERGICRGAPLEVSRIAARWSCPRCGRTFSPSEPLRCKECHAAAKLLEGDEIMLDRIELEVDDHV
jgi:hydrogenase nickel incorporation protein HypA/HybF